MIFNSKWFQQNYQNTCNISELVEKVCFIIIAKLVHLRAMQIVCAISKNNCLPLMVIDTLWLVYLGVHTFVQTSFNLLDCFQKLLHKKSLPLLCIWWCLSQSFLSKLTSVVRWHVFPFMTWEIMAGCQLISLAEKELTTSANCLGKQRHGVLWGCNWVKKLVRLIKKPV